MLHGIRIGYHTGQNLKRILIKIEVVCQLCRLLRACVLCLKIRQKGRTIVHTADKSDT